MKRYLLGIMAGVLAVAALVVTQTAVSAKPTKTTICHRTHSGKKPYVKMTVSKSVLKGHRRHAQDIIPAPREGCPTVVLSPDKGGVLLTANLLGTNEVPPADLDGTGTAMIRLQAGEGRLCFKLTAANILLPAIAAHVHVGAAGVNGPIVVPLTPPDATGMSEGCVNVSRTLVGQILANPAGYYANVHTTDFPGGAIRGQLS
jgi:CHRD domain